MMHSLDHHLLCEIVVKYAWLYAFLSMVRQHQDKYILLVGEIKKILSDILCLKMGSQNADRCDFMSDVTVSIVLQSNWTRKQALFNLQSLYVVLVVVTLWQFSSVQFSSRCYLSQSTNNGRAVIALEQLRSNIEQAHNKWSGKPFHHCMPSTPSLRSLPNIGFQTVRSWLGVKYEVYNILYIIYIYI